MIKYLVAILFACGEVTFAQIPLEVFVGNEKTAVDVLWFRSIKNQQGEPTSFLFFNRNRAVVDYHNRTSFGSTNALSFAVFEGLGVVLVGQFFNSGFYPKAGVQYYFTHDRLSIFSWAVVETLNEPDADWFVLGKYEPQITEEWRLYLQAEFLGSTGFNGVLNLSQRLRIGMGLEGWVFGFGSDFIETGKLPSLTVNANAGVFLRREF